MANICIVVNDILIFVLNVALGLLLIVLAISGVRGLLSNEPVATGRRIGPFPEYKPPDPDPWGCLLGLVLLLAVGYTGLYALSGRMFRLDYSVPSRTRTLVYGPFDSSPFSSIDNFPLNCLTSAQNLSPARPAPTVPTRVAILPLSTEVSYLNRNTAQWKGVLNQNPDEALLIAEQVLQEFSGSKPVTSVNTPTHKVITADVGFSWQSFGESVEVTLEIESDQSRVQRGFLTLITITSRSKMGITLVDWGKNENNVKVVVGLLSAK